MYRLLIVGGDMRYVHLAECFAAENISVSVCGFNDDITFSTKIQRETRLSDAAEKADVIVLPLPASYDKVTVNTPLCDECLYLNDIYKNVQENSVICLGKYDISIFEQRGIRAIDYALREDFACLNAVPTSEGAIHAAMNILDTTLFSIKALVCGFGRCSKTLALSLKSLGSNVTVSARSLRDLSFAQALGFETLSLSELSCVAGDFDIIFNSIPQIIFTADVLKNIKTSCPIIDIASAPGCAVKEEAHAFGIKYLFLPGLPGKYAPKTAAQIIRKTVMNIIRECGKDAY